MPSMTQRLFGLLRGLARAVLNPGQSQQTRRPQATRQTQHTAQAQHTGQAGLRTPYLGDFTGTGVVRYSPRPDGRPDPGEIVWTWVPFEEDHSQGKDRPVLLVGRTDRALLALMLTSKDHDGDTRRRTNYVDLGTGDWDPKRRPSEVRLDRVLQVRTTDVRREGSVLDAWRFEVVAEGLRKHHGWR